MHVAPGVTTCRAVSSWFASNFQFHHMKKKQCSPPSPCAVELVHTWNNNENTHKPMRASSALTILTDIVTLVTLGCLLSASECPLKNNNVPRNVRRLRSFDTELWKCMQSPMRAESNLLRHKQNQKKIKSRGTNTWQQMSDSQTTESMDECQRTTIGDIDCWTERLYWTICKHWMAQTLAAGCCYRSCKHQTVSSSRVCVCGDLATVTNL